MTVLFSESQRIFGMPTLLSATITTTVIGMLVAIPLGLGAAIYLSEYASPGAHDAQTGAGDPGRYPDQVYGFFALTFITSSILQAFTDVGTFNMLAAGLVMGIMMSPRSLHWPRTP